MGKLKVTITHGDNENRLTAIVVGMIIVVFLAAMVVPTAGAAAPGFAFLSSIITYVVCAMGAVVVGICSYFGWRHWKDHQLDATPEQIERWEEYCRSQNDEYIMYQLKNNPEVQYTPDEVSDRFIDPTKLIMVESQRVDKTT